MNILIDVSMKEFSEYCCEQIRDNLFTINKSLNIAFDHFFEQALKKTPGFVSLTRLNKVIESSSFFDLKPVDYLSHNSDLARLLWLKYRLNLTLDFENEVFNIILPSFLSFEKNSSYQKEFYIKEKKLKTIKNIFLEIVRIRIEASVIKEMSKNLDDEFFCENLYKIGGEKHFIEKNGIITKEDLPYKYVCYPGAIGAFIGFKEFYNDNIVFCECQKTAITNYIEMRFQKHEFESDALEFNSEILYQDINGRYIFDPTMFPIDFVKYMHDKKFPQDKTIIENISFKNNLCHECNKRVPNYYYPVSYTKFYKQYGWYINKRLFEYGIHPSSLYIDLPNMCTQEIKNLYVVNERKYYTRLYWQSAEYLGKKTDISFESVQKIKNEIRNSIENEVRLSFGYKKIGEEWISETLLFKEIKKYFKNEVVIHHGKPIWLGAQHFDIWLPERNIAIEYQGAQHYKPIERFGGEEAFKKNMERDERKKVLCIENGTLLICVDEDDDINSVLEKLKKYIENLT